MKILAILSITFLLAGCDPSYKSEWPPKKTGLSYPNQGDAQTYVTLIEGHKILVVRTRDCVAILELKDDVITSKLYTNNLPAWSLLPCEAITNK